MNTFLCIQTSAESPLLLDAFLQLDFFFFSGEFKDGLHAVSRLAQRTTQFGQGTVATVGRQEQPAPRPHCNPQKFEISPNYKVIP